MNAIRLTKRVDSDTLHLPELLPFVGQQVEIIVLSDSGAEIPTEEALRERLRGTITRDDDPLVPIAETDWEVLK